MVKKKEVKQKKQRVDTGRNKMKRSKIRNEKRKQCEGWKWRRFRKIKYSCMHKRSKIEDTIKPDLTVSMKAARIER